MAGSVLQFISWKVREVLAEGGLGGRLGENLAGRGRKTLM